jgi:pimeloyl-ACP methyl ester carboxylesterase
MTPTEWRDAGHTFVWRGLRVFYRDEGSGPPLLLLHGFPTSSWDRSKIWLQLAGRYRVIALDYGGFGFSDKPAAGPYSIFAYADQTEALLDRLGIGRAHVLAHDLGDTVAQELLARDRERPEPRYPSAAFLNGGVLPELHRPRPAQKILNSPIGIALARITNRRMFERGLAEVFGPHTKPTTAELDGFWQCASFADGVRNYHRIIQYIGERMLYRERWVAPILDGRVATCFINGHRDPVSGKHVVDRLRVLRPDAEIYDLPDIGHYPQSEAPEAVLRGYMTFREARA